jgi:hypothetical protein
MSVSSRKFVVSGSSVVARERQKVGADQRAPLSSEVADVAKRPKKRPDKRERSSMMIRSTRPQAMLV